MSSTTQARQALTRRLFPQGIPRLWCPTLTHFSAKGKLDELRIRKQLRTLAPHVRGLLVPGSTGEGWEMSAADIRSLLSVVLDAAKPEGIGVLIGVLKTNVDAVLTCIDSTVAWLKETPWQSSVVGFTVCPPKGRNLSQSAILDALSAVLEKSLPTALYQLPQVTENEMSPETVATLAERYPNFYLFKDTSGKDCVALSQGGVAEVAPVAEVARLRRNGRIVANSATFGGVFLVRGAEGDYAKWPKSAGGPYDGFLLSTANVFARQLVEIQSLLDRGQRDEAATLARRIEAVVKRCFETVTGFPTGNPFTNANKALDHVMAYGRAALTHEPPLLYSGVRLPAAFIENAFDLLRESQFLPETGYAAT